MSKTVTVEQLSPDQRSAYDAVMRWVGDPSAPQIMSLGGYAGTGKTTVVSLIAGQVELPAFCAYTGKAASVLKRNLKRNGIATTGALPKDARELDRRPFCGTIHSLIYRICSCRDPQAIELQKPCPDGRCDGETRWEDGKSVCARGHAGLIASLKELDKLKPIKRLIPPTKDEDGRCPHCRGKEWLRREALDRMYPLIVVDEASMVEDSLLRDLSGYKVKILAVGDHGQLPPIGGVGSLMRDPQLRLEKIHRQAEGNPIIALSKAIRERGIIPDKVDGINFEGFRFLDRLIEDRYADASPERLLEMGIVCYTNKRRCGLNTAVRRALGTARKGWELPQKGEHVVCLRNIRENGTMVANGMRGVLKSDAECMVLNGNENPHKLHGVIEFPEDEIKGKEYQMVRVQFGRDRTISSLEELSQETGCYSFSEAGELFDFGYAMTAHKMQGSQVKDLVVCVERPGMVSGEDWRRWLYTAVTRASETLTVIR